MLRAIPTLLFALAFATALAQDSASILRQSRTSPGDLEVGGELTGVAPGQTRYLRYEDLLKLEQVTYTVSDDSNLSPGTEISGVPLDALAKFAAKNPSSTTVVAICDDKYRTHYPRSYRSAHRPIMVLRVNGKQRDQWPKSREGEPLGPWFISHPFFKPSFKVLSHEDEPQIPYGIIRIEFHRESVVYGAIKPGAKWTPSSQIGQGYIIASQDCFRCHNFGAQGGAKSGVSWPSMSGVASTDSQKFRAIIRDPKSVNPKAIMPAQPGYDDATLDALTAYFRTFAGKDSHLETKPKP